MHTNKCHKSFHPNREQHYTMEQLVELAKSCIAEQDFSNAQAFLERAASASNLPAKFRLACLLRDTPELEMPQSERYSRSERLFRELENTLSKPKDLEAVSQELSILFHKKKMPISFVGYKLRAYHLRQVPDLQQLSLIECYINKLDLSKLDQDPRGVGVLGLECLLEPRFQKIGIYFLRETVKYGDKQGILALSLSDFLENNPSIDEESSHLVSVYKTIAAQRGNPDILRKHI